MIVIEEKLTEAFAQLPAIQKTESFSGFKPVYKWGDEKHLNKQLILFSKENKTPYPLIYQLSNSSEQNHIRKEATTNLILIVGILNDNDSLLNENRWAMSYANVLYPVVNNIERCIKGAGIFRYDNTFRMSEYPFYSDNKTENKTLEKWDAVRIEWNNLTIEGKRCINPNIFKQNEG